MTTVNENEVPIGAIMSALHGKTVALRYQETKSRELTGLHIQTLGRLVKYEGQSAINEAFDYMVEGGAFIKVNSRLIGVKTHVADYKTKSGKIIKAHYTHNNHYLETAKKGDLEPKYYEGNFHIKEFAEQFRSLLRRADEKSDWKTITDFFNLTGNTVPRSPVVKIEDDEWDVPIATLLKKK
jgi:hypothetical protein